MLVEAGVDIDKANVVDQGSNPVNDAFNPLNVAAQGGHSKVVEVLIAAGADVNGDSAGVRHTPLMMASRSPIFGDFCEAGGGRGGGATFIFHILDILMVLWQWWPCRNGPHSPPVRCKQGQSRQRQRHAFNHGCVPRACCNCEAVTGCRRGKGCSDAHHGGR